MQPSAVPPHNEEGSGGGTRNSSTLIFLNFGICKSRTIFAQEEQIVNCLFIYINLRCSPLPTALQPNLAGCNKADQPTNMHWMVGWFVGGGNRFGSFF